MPRTQSRYVCQECGAVHAKWTGRCEACGGWNSLIEEAARESAPKGLGPGKARRLETVGLGDSAVPPPRRITGNGEFDRVCGGGLVPGSALLIGGDPGIGKSTLLLQILAALASGGLSCLYISGEESLDQVRLRAARLAISGAPVALAAATSVRDIAAALDRPGSPRIVVIDSIQTAYIDTVEAAPGTVSQVRASAQELIRLAKAHGFTLFLIGHVTKEGMIAGPRVLEHMVDSVLYFEGDRSHQFRILRAVKNRYGPTDEIGVFEMTDRGLAEVANPSALFLARREKPISGTAVFAGMEGTRPMLVEIEALVAPSPLGMPRRAVVGWDGNRLAMLLAVLEARCGVQIGARDVYLNVAGGLRVAEPAADLAAAAALLSALSHEPAPDKTVFFGEVGLSGEVRAVGQAEARLREAAKLGFAVAYAPSAPGGGTSALRVHEIRHLRQLIEVFMGDSESPHKVLPVRPRQAR
ncbi:MAG: DNA repair protein RadA [Stellaceae bacterium]